MSDKLRGERYKNNSAYIKLLLTSNQSESSIDKKTGARSAHFFNSMRERREHNALTLTAA